MMQEMQEAEMTDALGAEKGEGTESRLGYRSGYYTRTLVTRMGHPLLYSKERFRYCCLLLAIAERVAWNQYYRLCCRCLKMYETSKFYSFGNMRS